VLEAAPEHKLFENRSLLGIPLVDQASQAQLAGLMPAASLLSPAMHGAQMQFQDDGSEAHLKRLGNLTVQEPSLYFQQPLLRDSEKNMRQINA